MRRILDAPGTTWPRWPRGSHSIVSWQPLPAELVQSRRLPDGLIEVRRHGQAEPDFYVLEIATYPEARVADQVVDDTALVYLDRRVLPEAVVLFLHPKRNIEAAGAVNLRSRQGWVLKHGAFSMCEFPRVCCRFTLPWYKDLVILQPSHGGLPARAKPKRRSKSRINIRKRIRSKSKSKIRTRLRGLNFQGRDPGGRS